ncbi:MAG: DnaJ C-terminal domain-containing protein [Bacteriovorax sp.]|nr:DnaJ C-terminal domain-containing protein [Bacteriovorax sp.]
MKSPYDILGVTKKSSQEEIKKAYRDLVKKHHPDLNPGNKKAEEKFKTISNAYDLIGTPENRIKYDSEENLQQNQEAKNRSYSKRRPPKSQNSRYASSYADQFGSDEFAENIFSEFFKSHSAPPPSVNPDTHYQMSISFQESILGAEKVITLANGKNLQIKIPPGIKNGSKLRFKGQGSSDRPNLPSGDAIVEVKTIPLEGWTRIDNDLEMELPISLFEAILGDDITVNTMYGTVEIKIPPGSNSGSKLRIKGKGVKKDDLVGNQIVKLKIVLPKNPETELKTEMQKMKNKFNYNPREDNLKNNKNINDQNKRESRSEV